MTGAPAPKFAAAARVALADTRARRELRAAAAVFGRRRAAVPEPPDWEALRAAGHAIRDAALLGLDAHLERLERAVTQAGGTVHWAADAAQARRVVTALSRAAGADRVVLDDSLPVRELALDAALSRAGITTAGPPARGADPGGEAEDGGGAARVAVAGVDFMVAETGTLVFVEAGDEPRASGGEAETLVAVAGIETVVPEWRDMEVLLQLLPRSLTGERMTALVTCLTGVVPGDGPREVHLVLVDNGRTRVLEDEIGRDALRCIRCRACHHVCPVYERTGGAPYGPVHTGPIGAILTPQLRGVESAAAASLPYASTLCGACADVCPVRIDIPEVLVHLRGEVVESRRARPVPPPELVLMRGLAWTMGEPRRYEAALRRGTRWARLAARGGRIRRLPGLLGAWTDARDLPAPPAEPFRAWWARRRR
ncbi:LUD domain-containing protein [Spirillospora albida]|uniref:LUD domain-containing protein n=1 Tax=Spirillospora albida TaxID=58123 RepID=UPI0004BE9AC3|nr:LUD domain-containing protein [Spirillospora albida]